MPDPKFNWRDHLDQVNDIINYWNEIANHNEGWSPPVGVLWIEGAIYGLTGKEVTVSCGDHICQALGIPARMRDDGMMEWGDEVKTGATDDEQ